MPKSARDRVTIKTQNTGVCLVSTMPAMRSVIVPRVWPGPMIGGLTPLGGRMSGAAISYAFSVPDASLGLGFRTAATYVVRGRVFNSASRSYLRGPLLNFATALFLLLMSPKVIASVGQTCWQAVLISPSLICRSSFSEAMRAAVMRCTQYVHFSITPRLRTVTSGLRPSLRLSVVQFWKVMKLKRRTRYGQLFEQ